MADLSKLNASIATLKDNVEKLITADAAAAAAVQPGVDAAQAAVDAVNAEVLAASAPPAPAPAP